MLVLISLVPLAVTTVLTYVRFQKTLEQDALKSESQLAAQAAEKIKSFIVSQVGVLDTIANLHNPEFTISLAEKTKIVENVLYRSDNFTDIDVVNKDGKEILRQDRLIVFEPGDLVDLSASDAFKTVRAKGLYVGPTYLQGGRVFFDLGRPIVDSQGTFSGAIFGQVDAKVMQQVTETISSIAGAGGRVYMVDDKGSVIAHPDISYVLAEKNLSTLPSVGSIAQRRPDIELAKSYNNEKGEYVLGSAYPVTLEPTDVKIADSFQINWYVIVEQLRSVIFAEADRVALFAALVSLLVVLLATVAAVYFARRISKPVEALYTATQEFGKGNLVYRTQIETNDEIGDLARNFDSMAKTLARSIQNLRGEERIISAERDKLSIILSGITNAVIAVDLKRKIILFNKAAQTLTGLNSKEAVGRGIQDVAKIYDHEKKLLAEEYCPIKNQKNHTEGIVFQKNHLKFLNSLGQERTVNLIAGNISQGVSIDLGCILTFQDITREAVIEKTKNEFVSIAAHQLRTPLTAIKWGLQELSSGETGKLKAGQQKMVGDAAQSTTRMISLVNDLLNVSRIEEGKFGLSLKKQPLLPVLESVKDTLSGVAAKKKITLKFNVPAILPQINIDKEKIEIALNNLVDNAIKYSAAGKTVEIGVKAAASEIIFSVKDTGIGIPAEEFDRVFSKFFRTKEALLLHTDGSGLGLYVTKNIVSDHGGKIWFESKEARGTTFYISLPIPAKTPKLAQ